MLNERINDRSFVDLICKWLNAGVLDAEGIFRDTYAGTPRGGIISPVLANVYLHFILDIWLEKRVKRESRGAVMFVRYADDFVVCFERKADADAFYAGLGARLGKFGLELALEKSGIVAS